MWSVHQKHDGAQRNVCSVTQAWAGFEVKHQGFAIAYELFAEALESEEGGGAPDRQVSILKAWGDAKGLQGSWQAAGGLYEHALRIQPDSLLTVMVKPKIVVVKQTAFSHITVCAVDGLLHVHLTALQSVNPMCGFSSYCVVLDVFCVLSQ